MSAAVMAMRSVVSAIAARPLSKAAASASVQTALRIGISSPHCRNVGRWGCISKFQASGIFQASERTAAVGAAHAVFDVVFGLYRRI
jgi:hypothetical protein